MRNPFPSCLAPKRQALIWTITLSLTAAPAAAIANAPLLEHFIQPSIAQFRTALKSFQQSLNQVCLADNPASATTLESPFANLLARWSALVPLRFGPLIDQNRFERLYFWPDPRGLVQRQSLAFVTGKARIATTETLADQSVAVQGLPALEQAIYGDQGIVASTQHRQPACAYAQAIVINAIGVAQELQQAWNPQKGFGQQFAQPSEQNPVYRTEHEIDSEIVKALAGGLQFLKELELAPMKGPTAQRALPQRGPFYRSGNTFSFAQQRVKALQDLYRHAEFDLPADAQWAQDSFLAELDRASKTLSQIDAQKGNSLNAEQFNQAITLLGLQLGNAYSILVEDIAPALELTLGFNALDGD